MVYALVKFARLALECNPNIIEALYVEARHILHCDSFGERLRRSATVSHPQSRADFPAMPSASCAAWNVTIVGWRTRRIISPPRKNMGDATLKGATSSRITMRKRRTAARSSIEPLPGVAAGAQPARRNWKRAMGMTPSTRCTCCGCCEWE